MSQFSDIKLSWKDKEYTVRANNVMRAIAIIEDHLTIKELSEYAQAGSAPMGKLSLAYSAVLRYAGCDVSAEDVYLSIFAGGSSETIMQAINGLLHMMLPPNIIGGSDTAAAKKPQRAKESGSSKKHTKSQSVVAGG